MKIVRAHNTTREAARATVEGLVPALVQQAGDEVSSPASTWEDDVLRFSFSARGMSVNGRLEVTESEIRLDVKLPLAARLFEGAIRSRAERAIDDYLSGDLSV